MRTKMNRVLLIASFLACLVCSGSAHAAAASLKALIVDGQNNHKWAATTPVLREMMEKCGRFSVDVATCPPRGKDMSGYLPEFAKYDVVVVNNGNNADSWSQEAEQAFERFVENGGGVVSYHAADNAWADWQAWNEMIAIGGWGGRNEKAGRYLYMDKQGNVVRDNSPGKCGNHGKQTEFEITVRDNEHPIMRGLPPTFMHGPDELYSFLRGPGQNVQILATAHSAKSNRGRGYEEPILMTITYGKGRVFHTVIGHAVSQIKRGSFVTTFLRGAEWAATGKVTLPVPEGFPDQAYPPGK